MTSPAKLLAAAAVAVAALFVSASVYAQTITITKVRDLYMGVCPEGAGQTFTVAAADAPGASACPNAFSARFEVTGGSRQRVTISLLTDPVTITNGTRSRSVNLTAAPTGSRRLSVAGTMTIYVGGSVPIAANTGSVDLPLTGTSTLRVQ